nr:putative reverse transcriptase domain-containing protein [Tanacetum cinerariifolium]
FIPKRSLVEAIHLIRSLLEKYKERQRDMHIAFLDLEKVYDSVPWELVWKTLVNKGTTRRYIRVIRDMYDLCENPYIDLNQRQAVFPRGCKASSGIDN